MKKLVTVLVLLFSVKLYILATETLGNLSPVHITDTSLLEDVISNSPAVELSNDIINITGKITFYAAMPYLPPLSCAVVKLKDVTIVDIPSNVLSSVKISISNQHINRSIEYFLQTKKPLSSHLNRLFTLTAVVNIGWCPHEGSSDWIRKGDYLSIERHRIELQENLDSYHKDISVVCQGCTEKNRLERGNSSAIDLLSRASSEEGFPAPALVEYMPSNQKNDNNPITYDFGFAAALTDEIISITGEIFFPAPVDTIPVSSCAIVNLKDVSYFDLSSNILASVKINISGNNMRTIEYSLDSKRPIQTQLDRVYVVTAVVNIGWCKSESSDEWLRKGDYLSLMRFRIMMNDSSISYTRDINVVCYLCDERIEESIVGSQNEVASFDDPSDNISSSKTPLTPDVEKNAGKTDNIHSGDGIGPFAELGEEGMNISGEVLFPPGSVKLPGGSCILVELKDVYIMNNPFYVLASNKIEILGNNYNRSIPYVLYATKPMNQYLNHTFALTAVVNIDWCHDGNSAELLRKGDYVSVSRHQIEFNREEDSYKRDINVVCYDCLSKKNTSLLSDKIINIRGKIVFPSGLKSLPKDSCAIVEFEDVSIMDGPNNVLASTEIDLSGKQLTQNMEYSLSSLKSSKKFLQQTFSVSVLVKVGWCKDNTSIDWIRKGDYLSVVRHYVNINTGDDDYYKDVNVVCYDCREESYNTNLDNRIITEPVATLKQNKSWKFDEESFLAKIPERFIENHSIDFKFGEKVMNISGVVILPPGSIKVPENSCMLVELKDVSIMDTPSYILASTIMELRGSYYNQTIPYTLYSKMPAKDYINRIFALTAVINIGWCQNEKSNKWLKKGDYLSVRRHHIELRIDQDSYNKDINVVCYDCIRRKNTSLLSDKMIIIRGKIIFPSELKSLPEDSCAIVELKDVSITDGPSYVLASTEIDLSRKQLTGNLEYSLSSKKPSEKYLQQTFSVSVLVKVGWCKDNTSIDWIRKGDYLSVVRHRVNLNTEEDYYDKDVNVFCYECVIKDLYIDVENTVNTGVSGDRNVSTDNPNSIDFIEGIPELPFVVSGPSLAPELTDEDITVEGEIIFPTSLGTVPENSCLSIMLKDVSFMDGPSYILGSMRMNVSQENLNKTLIFSLSSKKPSEKYLNRVYALSAVLNLGWLKEESSDEWIRKGDYLSVSRHRIMLNRNSSLYKRNINVVCYDCKKQIGIAADAIENKHFSAQDDKLPPVTPGEVFPGRTPESPIDGGNPVTEITDEVINITGKVLFINGSGILPEGSCLSIKLKDVSIMDGPSYVIASVTLNVIGKDLNQTIPYVLSSKKPAVEYLNRIFALNVVLNVGWCRKGNSDEWIRKGDYLSVSRHRLKLNSINDAYSRDIEAVCYGCNEEEITDKKTDKRMRNVAIIANDEFNISPTPKDEDNVTDGTFPVGSGLVIELGEDAMNISGQVHFPFAMQFLPTPSCAIIKLRDVSFMDVYSNVLASTKMDISGKTVNRSIEYILFSKKPVQKYMNRVFSLSAVINVGWCQDKNSYKWIQKGDFLSVESQRIRLGALTDSYSKDINVICYECSQKYDANSLGDKSTTALVEADDVTPENPADKFPSKFPNIFKPEMTDEDIHIKGEINLPKVLGKLPVQSCLTVKFNDVTFADAPSYTLAYTEINLSMQAVQDTIEYVLKSKKPADKYLDHTYSLTAVLNIGWCHNKETDEWIRIGDYLSVARHPLELKSNQLSYRKNIDVEHYGLTSAPTKGEIIKTDNGSTHIDHVDSLLENYRGLKGFKGAEGSKGSLGPIGITGPPGLRGPPGYQGSDGSFGNTGPPGIKGRRGMRGIDGLPGFSNGPKGSQGERGIPGGFGAQGVHGFKGYKGQRGEPGLPGIPGAKGNQGERGSFGSPGLRGHPGKKGAEGLMGHQGAKGKHGPRGPPGKTGNQGMIGDSGDHGPPGIKGYMGLPGRMGFTGTDGSAGKIGETGPKGSPGVQGDTGYAGIPGKFGSRGIPGESGERGDIGPRGLKGGYGEDGQTGVVGSRGDQGPRGMRGLPGERGEQGKRGSKGNTGLKGLIGFHGFKGIPGTAGQYGQPGLAGDKGEAGSSGEQGANGYKGSKGSTGDRGKEGAIGPRGPQGPVGESGSDGENGAKGVRGDGGETGPIGEKGIRGSIGIPGTLGIKGRKGGRGIIGSRGVIGAKGEEGYPGHPGEPGARGHYGQQGLKGPTGEDGEVGQIGLKGDKGLAGDVGKQGIPGEKGLLGDQGGVGAEGSEGLKGDPGLAGKIGDQGITGESGLVGDAGVEGPIGLQGKPGIQGTIGPDGKPGGQGMVGLTGKVGPNGQKGDIGNPGKRGRQGPPGLRGPAGPGGEMGEDGFPGEKGLAGSQGKQGDPGERGAPGRRGVSGVTGSIGLQGPKGKKGPVGRKGYPGPTGNRGLPGNDGPTGNLGVAGLPGTPGPYGAVGDSGLPGKPGKQGPDGIDGIPGPVGETGKKGDKGARGKQGKSGVEGLSGELGSFGVPGDQGLQGEKGDPGKQGKEGLDGPPGIKGDDGDRGAPGKRGKEGINGLPGKDGPRGKAGNPGIPGADGKNATKGESGIPGPQGATGDRGKQGKDGLKGKRGSKGATGKRGHYGLKGLEGYTGYPGDVGPQGLKGKMGKRGIPGLPGSIGIQGDMGTASRRMGKRGPRGPVGDSGPRGSDGDIGRKGGRGAPGPEGKQGEKGFLGQTGTGGVPGQKGASGYRGRRGIPGKPGSIGNRGRIGDKGVRGDNGEDGEEGFRGIKGQSGETGPVGLSGPPGAPPIESLIPNAQWRDYYRKNPTHFYQAVAGEYLTYISNEVDSIKYPAGTKSNPALNCKEIFDNRKYTENGFFWIDPTRGCAWDEFEVYCNFTSGGESCLLMNTSTVSIRNLERDSKNAIIVSKHRKISYGLSRPQFNFIRILSNQVSQEITLYCSVSLGYLDNINLMGWNKKLMNAADKNQVKVIENTCEKKRVFEHGKIVLRIVTDMDLSDLPIVDVIIKQENIDSIYFGTTCFL